MSVRTSRSHKSTTTTTDNDLAIAQALANEEQELADQDFALRMQMQHGRRSASPDIIVRGNDVTNSARNTKNCPGNHGLQEYRVVSSAQRVTCNTCNRRVRPDYDNRVFSCVICNYDVCQTCYNDTGDDSTTSSTSATTSNATGQSSSYLSGLTSTVTGRDTTVTGRSSTNGNSSRRRTGYPAASRDPRSSAPFSSLVPPSFFPGGDNGNNGKYVERAPPVPTHMCQVPVILGENMCVEMMVDTGAQSSVITMPLVKRLGLESRLDCSHQGIANGVGQARIVGKLRNIICELGHVEFCMDFIVLDTQDSILLLGLDQMRKYKCIVDLEQEIIYFGGNGGVEVKMLPANEQSQMRYLNNQGCPMM